MRNITLLLFVLLFTGCKNNTEYRSNSSYFKFDEVDHYYLDISSLDIWNLMGKKNASAKELQLSEMLANSGMKENAVNNVVKQLEGLGYKKTILPSKISDSIDYVFSDKNGDEKITTMCIPEYRDILVFKKDNQITGFAKICFTCYQCHLVYSRYNHDDMMSMSNYNILFRQLHPKIR